MAAVFGLGGNSLKNGCPLIPTCPPLSLLENQLLTAAASPQLSAPRPPSAADRFAPLKFRQILVQSFKHLGHNPRRGLIGGVLIPFAVSVAALLLVSFTVARADAATPGSIEELSRLTDNLGASNLQSFLSIAVTVFAQAYVLMNFREAMLGNHAPNATIFAGLRNVWGSLIVWALIGIGVGIVFTVICVTVTLAFSIGAAISGLDPDDPAALSIVLPGVLITILLASIPLIWAMTRLSLTPAVLILDRMPLGGALKRSWQLTRRRFWRVFGAQAAIGILIAIACLVVVAIFLGTSAATVNGGMNAVAAPLNSTPFVVALLTVESLVAAVGVAVLGYAIGLLSVDARMRDDWLAASLNGYTDARASGVPSTALHDPFLSPPEAFKPYAPQTAPAVPDTSTALETD